MEKVLFFIFISLCFFNISHGEYYSDDDIEKIYDFRVDFNKKMDLHFYTISSLGEKELDDIVSRVDEETLKSTNKVKLNNLRYIKYYLLNLQLDKDLKFILGDNFNH